MSMKTISLAATMLLAMSTGLAYAQMPPAPFYFGAGIGQSKVKTDTSCADLAALFDPGYSCSVGDTATGWKVFAGYQVNEYFAAEIGYVNLGKFTGSANGTITSVPANFDFSAKANGISADAIGSWPLTPEFALIARLGLYSWSLDVSGSASGGGTSIGAGEKASGSSANFGFGVRYDFDRFVSLRAEFQRFKDVGDSNTGKSDVDLLEVSVAYHFK